MQVPSPAAVAAVKRAEKVAEARKAKTRRTQARRRARAQAQLGSHVDRETLRGLARLRFPAGGGDS